MKNILILTDFSDNALNALKYAQQLFTTTRCNFYLLHVSDFIHYPIDSSYTDDNSVAIAAISPSKKQLNDLIKTVEKKSVNINHHYCYEYQ